MDAPQQPHPRAATRKPQPAPAAAAEPASGRHVHRERDFGVGYGNSSGYASERRFTSVRIDPLFRLG